MFWKFTAAEWNLRMQMIHILEQCGFLDTRVTRFSAGELFFDGYLNWQDLAQIQSIFTSEPWKAARMLLEVIGNLRMQMIHILEQCGFLDTRVTGLTAAKLFYDGYLKWQDLEQIQSIFTSEPWKAAGILLEVIETTGSAGGFGTRVGSNIPALIGGPFGQNTSSSMVTGMFGGGQDSNTFGVSQNISFDYCRRLRTQIRKQFAWLKNEMDKWCINKVADALYNDGHLVLHAYERIVDRSQPRKNRIDLLLKKVILGNTSIVQAFMHILQSDSHLSFVAERINKTDVSPEEMQGRPSVGGALMFHISNTDIEVLIEFLEDGVVVEQINDNLVSKFYIRICDHTRILHYSEVQKKLYKLFELMKRCPDEVYNILEHVLIENKLEHVLQYLERNRIRKNKRVLSSINVDYPSRQKHMRACYGMQETSSCAEIQIVSGLKRASVNQKLRSQASSQLNLKVREVSNGSS